MRQLINVLKEITGRNVEIHINHQLFGEQHIKMNFEPEIELGIGFRCKGQAIYIDKDDLNDYVIKDKHIVLSGKMMRITIQEN